MSTPGFVRALLPAALAAAMFDGAVAFAHEATPQQAWPGATLTVGVGARDLSADDPYPAPRVPGLLEAGSPRADERGTDLDYAELGLSARFSPNVDATVRYTYHGGADPHDAVEALWLEARAPGWGLSGRGGRQEVPLGFENLTHSHARTFGIAPLTLRAAVDEAWIADGLRIDWRSARGLVLGVGGWQNSGYPGTDSGGINLATARVGWRSDSWMVEAGYGATESEGRALLTTGEGGHTHSVPECTTVTADRVCFEGDVDLWSVAARWQPEGSRWWLGGEYWLKREEGRLDSIFGTPDYEGQAEGGWIDLGYRLTPTLALAARIERLALTNELTGVNAGLVAEQASIADADREPTAVGLVVAWQPYPALRLLGEWHREELNGDDNTVVLLRAQFHWAHELF